MRRLPAAALGAGDVVRPDGTNKELTIAKVHNADPEPGQLRWETKEGGDVIVNASALIEWRTCGACE